MTASRRRWQIAHLADKLRVQCWADLVSWALKSDYDSYHEDSRLRWLWVRLPYRPRGYSCGPESPDVQRCGTCYCGKVATTAALTACPDLRAKVIVTPSLGAPRG